MATADEERHEEVYDMLVIGAGVSGVSMAKNAIASGMRTLVIERSDHVGGLWHYDPDAYGVMKFTHINVSKHNYCFSDFPVPDDVPDYMHHSHMTKYINDYVDHFDLRRHVRFNTSVVELASAAAQQQPQQPDAASSAGGGTAEAEDGARGSITVTGSGSGGGGGGGTSVLRARAVAVACGHHAKPHVPRWPGQGRFESSGGTVVHSVRFKDALDPRLDLRGKRVLVIGIGNSAVDVACNVTSVAQSVLLSSRSGAWVWPNYIAGQPTDHYACRAMLALPWRVGTAVAELLLRFVWGTPHGKLGLNPKMRALSAQPTVSGVLVHHLQRDTIAMRPGIACFEVDGDGDGDGDADEGGAAAAGGSNGRVRFVDGRVDTIDVVVQCTGYTIDLPFLAPDLRQALLDEEANELKLYKNVFSPELGDSLAFIGFVQPASGGIISMAETQSRWFVALQEEAAAAMARRRSRSATAGSAPPPLPRVEPLPSQDEMARCTKLETQQVAQRYYGSKRHTIQRDPILYNDDISARFGACPRWWHYALSKPALAWSLLFSSAGAAQWRLVGPGQWADAEKVVRSVPVTTLWDATGKLGVVALLAALWKLKTVWGATGPLKRVVLIALALIAVQLRSPNFNFWGFVGKYASPSREGDSSSGSSNKATGTGGSPSKKAE